MNRLSAMALAATSFALLQISPAGAVSDPVLHPYQQFATANCTIAGDCSIVFPAIATTGDTLIQHASCSFALAAGTTYAFASLGIQSDNPRNALEVFANSTSNGFTDYGINADTYLLIPKGQQPRIDVFGNSAAVQNLICTISGYYD
jgi:hypothetical protein